MRAFAGRIGVLAALLLLTAVVLPAGAQDAPLITIAESDTLGPYLADSEGMALYIFDRDTLGVSNCYDRCAENWPPLLVESADELTAAEGIPGVLGTTERTDGTLEVTYNGWPLYYWVFDETPADTTGHRVGRVWWLMPPATVYAAGNEELGKFLVGAQGMTLYAFANDEPGVSNCAGDCATNWPPLTVESAEAVVPGLNLIGEVGTIERADGAIQVTYNDMPLYYWKDDAALGDAAGQGRNDVWFVVKPETVGVGGSDELGEFLTSFDGMTLYVFANDEPGVSNCTDDCTEAWRPFTVGMAEDVVAPEGLAGTLGTIERADGGLQVTYNDLPLYFWQDDEAPGDTTGQGVGDVWSVAAVGEAM